MTGRRGHFAHLIARFREMGRPVTTIDVDADFASRILTNDEMRLWLEMDPRDRRHAVGVARRFVAALPVSKREEVAAALLHDVGKSTVDLGRLGRSVATILPITAGMRRYRRHEQVGAEMLRGIGAHPRTISLVAGTAGDDVAEVLRRADDFVE